MRIGILAVQGSFSLHAGILREIGVKPIEVRHVADLKNLAGIIIPGGESTTFRIILDESELGDSLLRELRGGLPAWGTCAGAILLGNASGTSPLGWGLIDIKVIRNGYGRQIDSFVAPLRIKGFEGEFDGVFIRAPRLINAGHSVDVLAEFENDPVMARQENILITAFHPELTGDVRIHSYFVREMCSGSNVTKVKSA
ncbi:pyridoxal 5'-phosphate synthase glutaminase subunit PdxT [bacterium]|nr:pyridoxal 5'-phosphate synthase glutaminase subunit PdxT [bacterium]